MIQQDYMTPPLPVRDNLDGQPLSIADYEKLELAARQSKKIRTAAAVAAFNGYTFTILAGFSAMFVIGGIAMGDIDWLGIIVTAGLGALGYNELRGRRMLLDFNPAAARMLGWNQIALIILITSYCACKLVMVYGGNNEMDRELSSSPSVKNVMGNSLGDLYKNLNLLLYGSVIVLSVIFQGINSIYYFTRKKIIEAYIRKTSKWVIEVQRRAAK